MAYKDKSKLKEYIYLETPSISNRKENPNVWIYN